VHATVTPIAAALAAGRVHHSLPADLAGGRIETDSAAFELETAVHTVEAGAQRECHGSPCRVEIERDFLSESQCAGRKQGY
jgi:hypothetical protein